MIDFRYSPEVSSALAKGLPIVALESTIISHGMPYPENVRTASEVENVIRLEGATPATIAIINGIVHIGLDENSLEILGQAGPSCLKCSRKDLSFAISRNLNGSTTVAATMYLAYKAGLKIFVTGGIGGVHRDVSDTWDVSADLIELGRTPVTVICAGAKSILDIPKTLEFLETQGVPVVVYKSQFFPAFFSPSSGIKVTHTVQTYQECAQVMKINEALGLNNGILLAVPLKESEENQGIDEVVQKAVDEAKTQGITGATLTPFLLKRVNELSDGDSLKTNIMLIKQNAQFGARVAVSYYQKLEVACIGWAGHEISVTDGNVEGSIAGMAKLACEIGNLGVKVKLVSAIGNDYFGSCLRNSLEKARIGIEHIAWKDGKTDCVLINQGSVTRQNQMIASVDFSSIESGLDTPSDAIVDGSCNGNLLKALASSRFSPILILMNLESLDHVTSSGILLKAKLLIVDLQTALKLADNPGESPQEMAKSLKNMFNIHTTLLVSTGLYCQSEEQSFATENSISIANFVNKFLLKYPIEACLNLTNW